MSKITEILTTHFMFARNRDLHIKNAEADIEKYIDKKMKSFWTDVALYVAGKKVDWYMDFAEFGATKLGLPICEDCRKKFELYVKPTLKEKK